jgi:hypothetical protein
MVVMKVMTYRPILRSAFGLGTFLTLKFKLYRSVRYPMLRKLLTYPSFDLRA